MMGARVKCAMTRDSFGSLHPRIRVSSEAQADSGLGFEAASKPNANASEPIAN